SPPSSGSSSSPGWNPRSSSTTASWTPRPPPGRPESLPEARRTAPPSPGKAEPPRSPRRHARGLPPLGGNGGSPHHGLRHDAVGRYGFQLIFSAGPPPAPGGAGRRRLGAGHRST